MISKINTYLDSKLKRNVTETKSRTCTVTNGPIMADFSCISETIENRDIPSANFWSEFPTCKKNQNNLLTIDIKESCGTKMISSTNKVDR